MKMMTARDNDEIRQAIYSIIEKIGREKIKEEVTSSTKLSQKYMDIIMKEGTTRLASELELMKLMKQLQH